MPDCQENLDLPASTLNGIKICQLNVEGISKSKCEYMGRFAAENTINVIVLQETHTANDTQLYNRGMIPGFRIIAAINHDKYGVVTYTQENLSNVRVIYNSSTNNISILAIKISDLTIVNIYKPPNVNWLDSVIPTFDHPCLYIGDFNSHHFLWGYRTNCSNGAKLMDWCDENNLQIIFNPKDKGTFHSGRWNTD